MTNHDHSEMTSQYCPVCGDKIHKNDTITHIEQYYQQNKDSIQQILLPKNTIQKIRDERPDETNNLRCDEIASLIDAPAKFTITYSGAKLNPEGITIIKKTVLDNVENYWSLRHKTLEKLESETT